MRPDPEVGFRRPGDHLRTSRVVERRVFVHALPRTVWRTLHDPACAALIYPELRLGPAAPSWPAASHAPIPIGTIATVAASIPTVAVRSGSPAVLSRTFQATCRTADRATSPMTNGSIQRTLAVRPRPVRRATNARLPRQAP